MQFFTSLTLLGCAALSAAQYAYQRAPADYAGYANKPVYVNNLPRQALVSGTGAANGGAFATGGPTGTGGAVATFITYTTQLIVTDLGDGTMIYQPVVTPTNAPGQYYANATSATFYPATPSVQDPLPTDTPPAAPAADNGAGSDAASSEAASAPEQFTGAAIPRPAPQGLTPYLTTIAGLAFFALLV